MVNIALFWSGALLTAYGVGEYAIGQLRKRRVNRG